MKTFHKTLAALITTFVIAGTPSLVLAGEWTDKSVHDSGDINTYKRPNQKSFTGPFDYSPINTVERAITSDSAPTNSRLMRMYVG